MAFVHHELKRCKAMISPGAGRGGHRDRKSPNLNDAALGDVRFARSFWQIGDPQVIKGKIL